MDKIEEHKRILRVFKNSWLILQEWDEKTSMGNMEFSKAPCGFRYEGSPSMVKFPDRSQTGSKTQRCFGSKYFLYAIHNHNC